MNYYINATTEHLSNSCFAGKSSLQTVDLQNVPYVNNDMNSAFRSLPNLTSVSNIADSVELMDCTFQNCQSLINAPELPANTTFMGGTFAECSNLVNAPTIPNNVSVLGYAFANCSNLVNAPAIPENTTDLGGSFAYCYNLVNAPDMSNSTNVISMNDTFYFCHNLVNAPDLSNCPNITSMYRTFYNCYSMTTFPEIPNSVTNMAWAFRGCFGLTNSPIIPNSVTNMCGTFCVIDNLQNVGEIGTGVTDMNRAFGWCPNIVGDIVIHSSNVINAASCFTSSNASIHKDVYIPFTYDNGVNTATYNAFINAGYTTTGASQGVYLRDIQYYNTTHTLTINTTPAEASVIFDSSDPNAVISGKSITAKSYSSLTITASYTGYSNKVELINPFGPWTNDVSLILTPEGQFSPGPYTADSKLTENNYVYSNFANTTGIQVPSTYNDIGNEIVVKFRLTKDKDSEAPGDKFLFGQDSLDLYIADGDVISFYTRNGPVTVLTPERNVWYWIKCKVTSNNYMIISTSTDGSTWTSLGEQSYWGTLPNRPIVLGAKNATSTDSPFPGEIDMSGFRVYNSNGVSIWGTEPEPVLEQ